jgi:hypothetical protein
MVLDVAIASRARGGSRLAARRSRAARCECGWGTFTAAGGILSGVLLGRRRAQRSMAWGDVTFTSASARACAHPSNGFAQLAAPEA